MRTSKSIFYHFLTISLFLVLCSCGKNHSSSNSNKTKGFETPTLTIYDNEHHSINFGACTFVGVKTNFTITCAKDISTLQYGTIRSSSINTGDISIEMKNNLVVVGVINGVKKTIPLSIIHPDGTQSRIVFAM